METLLTQVGLEKTNKTTKTPQQMRHCFTIHNYYKAYLLNKEKNVSLN